MSNGAPEDTSRLHVDNLIYAAQIESGECRLDLQPVHLPQLLGATVDVVRPLAAQRGITINSTLDAFGGTVHADPARLQHVVANVLAHAIQTTPSGAPLDVSLTRDDVRAEIRVLSAGPRFEEASELGLRVARQLTEMHGGSLHITSHGESVGSTFTIRLPLIALRVDDAADEQATPCAGLRVLVVDDEPDARSLVAAVLSHYGAVVDVAADALHAMASLTEHRYDVLVSDLAMPHDDGFTLIAQLRSSTSPNRQLPAVALTAHADARDQVIEAGFSAYVTKPVTPAALVNVIAAVARKRDQDRR